MYKIFLIICAIESGFNPNAVGDGGRAIGIAQIHEACAIDAGYEWSDARTVEGSYRIFQAYCKRYNRTDLDGVVDLWNGGPRGKASRAYKEKVRKLL